MLTPSDEETVPAAEAGGVKPVWCILENVHGCRRASEALSTPKHQTKFEVPNCDEIYLLPTKKKRKEEEKRYFTNEMECNVTQHRGPRRVL